MTTSSVFLAKRGLFPNLFNSSEGSSVGINATRNEKRTLSIVFRASKPKEANHLPTAPFLDIWAPFYHHDNGDAAASAYPRYLKKRVKAKCWKIGTAAKQDRKFQNVIIMIQLWNCRFCPVYPIRPSSGGIFGLPKFFAFIHSKGRGTDGIGKAAVDIDFIVVSLSQVC